MAILNRADLVSSVEKWLRRPSVAPEIPTFLQLCEADMQRRLNVAQQEQVANFTTVQGNPSVQLPIGFTEVRRVRLIQSYGDVDLWPVALAPSDSANWSRQGKPLAYAFVGDTMNLRPTPDTEYNLQMNYYAKFAPLVAPDDTNWILQEAPDAYLYGTLLHSAPYLGTDIRLPLWERGYEGALASVNTDDFNKRKKMLQRQTEVAHLTGRGPYNIYGGY